MVTSALPSDTKEIPLNIDILFDSTKLSEVLSENGFFLDDYRTNRKLLNKVWGKMGYTADEMPYPAFLEKVHPDDRTTLSSDYEKLISGEIDKMAGVFRFIAKDDTVHWLSVTYQILERDSHGKPALLLGHDNDITDLVEAQSEIRDRLVEIESLKDLVGSINQSLDFDETLKRIIEDLHKIIPFDRASVQILEDNQLKIVGMYGYEQIDNKDVSFPASGIDNPAVRALSTRRPIICNDVEHDFSGFVSIDQRIVVKSWLGIPLVYEGKTTGLFALDSQKEKFYNERHVRVASSVADLISIALEHARQHSKVTEQARSDRLTGVANRYGLETQGQEIFYRASKEDSPLGVLMIDIDHFKIVNDTYGHAYGDQVLKVIASSIATTLRIADYLVRYGGEEFVVLLPGTTTRDALVVAERIRQKIIALKVNNEQGVPTISIGVFSGIPGPQDILHEFIRRADLALYEAKEAGRNRTRVWTPNPEYFDKQGVASRLSKGE
jgi:diguanylate cyclase (GGDEF)-like protein/PAS domain S-box-containing protein